MKKYQREGRRILWSIFRLLRHKLKMKFIRSPPHKMPILIPMFFFEISTNSNASRIPFESRKKGTVKEKIMFPTRIINKKMLRKNGFFQGFPLYHMNPLTEQQITARKNSRVAEWFSELKPPS